MKPLGGKVMTTTCNDCNGKLGSKAEEALSLDPPMYLGSDRRVK